MQAAIQATFYDDENPQVIGGVTVPGEKTNLYTATSDFVTDAVAVPVIASGGAGCAEDFVKLFQEIPAVDAGLAASVFHFGEVDIRDLKKLLQEHGITVRL